MDVSSFIKKIGFIGWMSLVIVVALATVPLYASSYTYVFLTDILIYVILSVSWALFSGTTGYISLASAAFLGVGIYTSAILGNHLDMPLPAVIVILVLLGGSISAILAALVGALTLRLRGIYFAIFTFGLVELIKNFMLWYEVQITKTMGRFVILVDTEVVFLVMVIIFVITMATAYLIKRSRYGLALQSIAEYEEAAAHTGINVTRLKITVFAVSAFFMGAVGAIMATRWTYIDPRQAFFVNYSFMPVVMAIIGGLGHLYGPVFGAAIFAYIEEKLTTEFPYYYMLTIGIILVLAILYLPDGLVGIVQKLWRRIKGEAHAHT